jgi:methionine sulfoxide reductase heme-binding subunit
VTGRTTTTAPSVPAPRPVPELAPSGASPVTAPFEPHTPRRPTPAVADPPRTAADLARTAGLLVGILIASLVIGRLAGARGGSLLHDRMLPWILGRGLGVAAYVALTGTVVLGLWLRHPWRARFRRPSAAGILWTHVALAAGAVTLVAGHVAALALDRYAGVGWTGVFVPWSARFRPTPVALGTLALYGLVLVVATAALAGSIGRAVWFPVHSAAVLVFCVSLAHGATAGSDGTSLRWVYAASGLVVVVLQFTRWVAGTLVRGDGLQGR